METNVLRRYTVFYKLLKIFVFSSNLFIYEHLPTDTTTDIILIFQQMEVKFMVSKDYAGAS
jgi:hypothetical protein